MSDKPPTPALASSATAATDNHSDINDHLTETWSTLCSAAQTYWSSRRTLLKAAQADSDADLFADGTIRPWEVYLDRACATHPEDAEQMEFALGGFVCANAELPKELILPSFHEDVSGLERDEVEEMYSFLDPLHPTTEFSAVTIETMGQDGVWSKLVQLCKSSLEFDALADLIDPQIQITHDAQRHIGPPPLIQATFYAHCHTSTRLPDKIDRKDASFLARMSSNPPPDTETISAFTHLSESGDLPQRNQSLEVTREMLCFMDPQEDEETWQLMMDQCLVMQAMPDSEAPREGSEDVAELARQIEGTNFSGEAVDKDGTERDLGARAVKEDDDADLYAD